MVTLWSHYLAMDRFSWVRQGWESVVGYAL